LWAWNLQIIFHSNGFLLVTFSSDVNLIFFNNFLKFVKFQLTSFNPSNNFWNRHDETKMLKVAWKFLSDHKSVTKVLWSRAWNVETWSKYFPFHIFITFGILFGVWRENFWSAICLHLIALLSKCHTSIPKWSSLKFMNHLRASIMRVSEGWMSENIAIWYQYSSFVLSGILHRAYADSHSRVNGREWRRQKMKVRKVI
jgi:hypothetical protein